MIQILRLKSKIENKVNMIIERQEKTARKGECNSDSWIHTQSNCLTEILTCTDRNHSLHYLTTLSTTFMTLCSAHFLQHLALPLPCPRFLAPVTFHSCILNCKYSTWFAYLWHTLDRPGSFLKSLLAGASSSSVCALCPAGSYSNVTGTLACLHSPCSNHHCLVASI